MPRLFRNMPFQLGLIFLILVLLVASAGFYHYSIQKKEIKKDKQNELLAIADLKVSQIVNWRKERLADAATLRDNFLLAPQIKHMLQSSEKTRERRDILAWMASFKETYQYDDILLLDINGNILLSVAQRTGSVGPDAKMLIASALKTRNIIFSDLYRSKVVSRIRFSIVVPIMSKDKDEMLGVFLLRIDPYLFLYPLIEKWPTPSQTAETMLVRREKNEVLYLNDLRHVKGTALKFKLPISKPYLPAAMLVKGKEGIFEGIDYRGIEVLAAMRSVPNTSWGIVAKVDKEEVYAPIKVRLWNVMVVVGLCLLAAGLGVLLIWHKRDEEEQKKYREQLEVTVHLRTKELEQANKHLKKSYQDLESFSYSVSHDLRQPLVVIEWFAKNLLKKSGDRLSDDAKEKLAVIVDQAAKMTQLIKDLLAFSHASTREVRKSDIDMNALFQSAMEDIKITAGNRTVQFNVKKLPSAWGDEALIRQVVLNLLSNAVKYSAQREIAEIRINGEDKEGETIYSVRDNGVGFDSEQSERLFGLFSRLHPAEKFEGTGVGLALSKRIIDRHGGCIWAEGKPEEGAIFYFTLPKRSSAS
ncbi:MAG: hypothetical protein LLF86_01265 [Nitrospiraceae bacterium]|nr:hypothetical protein [Nitrospiraceae bacterium]